MTDPRQEAERLAGPHQEVCARQSYTAERLNGMPDSWCCDCPHSDRVAAIEAALRARAESWRAGVQAAALLGDTWVNDYRINWPEEAQTMRLLVRAIRALKPPKP